MYFYLALLCDMATLRRTVPRGCDLSRYDFIWGITYSAAERHTLRRSSIATGPGAVERYIYLVRMADIWRAAQSTNALDSLLHASSHTITRAIFICLMGKSIKDLSTESATTLFSLLPTRRDTCTRAKTHLRAFWQKCATTVRTLDRLRGVLVHKESSLK